MQTQGKTVMVLGTPKRILALIAVADEMRESSKEVINLIVSGWFTLWLAIFADMGATLLVT